MCLKHSIQVSSNFRLFPLQNVCPKAQGKFPNLSLNIKKSKHIASKLDIQEEKENFSFNKRVYIICKCLLNLTCQVLYITHVKALNWACPWALWLWVVAQLFQVPRSCLRCLSPRPVCHTAYCFSQTSSRFFQGRTVLISKLLFYSDALEAFLNGIYYFCVVQSFWNEGISFQDF